MAKILATDINNWYSRLIAVQKKTPTTIRGSTMITAATAPSISSGNSATATQMSNFVSALTGSSMKNNPFFQQVHWSNGPTAPSKGTKITASNTKTPSETILTELEKVCVNYTTNAVYGDCNTCTNYSTTCQNCVINTNCTADGVVRHSQSYATNTTTKNSTYVTTNSTCTDDGECSTSGYGECDTYGNNGDDSTSGCGDNSTSGCGDNSTCGNDGDRSTCGQDGDGCGEEWYDDNSQFGDIDCGGYNTYSDNGNGNGDCSTSGNGDCSTSGNGDCSTCGNDGDCSTYGANSVDDTCGNYGDNNTDAGHGVATGNHQTLSNSHTPGCSQTSNTYSDDGVSTCHTNSYTPASSSYGYNGVGSGNSTLTVCSL